MRTTAIIKPIKWDIQINVSVKKNRWHAVRPMISRSYIIVDGLMVSASGIWEGKTAFKLREIVYF